MINGNQEAKVIGQNQDLSQDLSEEKEEIEIIIKRSHRKTLAVEVHQDGSVILRAPKRASNKRIGEFLDQRRQWIAKYYHKALKEKERLSSVDILSQEEIKELKEQAGKHIEEKVEYYSREMGITYEKIKIGCQKTRWGSCSSKGTLSFNCLLELGPEAVMEYVVVHELCHRVELNHSEKFWNLVEEWMPDFQLSKEWLKDHGQELMAKIGH